MYFNISTRSLRQSMLEIFLSTGIFWNNIWVKIMPFNKLTVLDTIEIWGTSNCLLRYIGVGFKIFHCYLISSEHIDFFIYSDLDYIIYNREHS